MIIRASQLNFNTSFCIPEKIQTAPRICTDTGTADQFAQ